MSKEQPHSGSRWEPTASAGETADGADDATEREAPPSGPVDPGRDANHEAAADERPGAPMSPEGETATDRIATPASHPAPGLGVFPAVPVGASPKPRNRRRAGVLAAVAAGLLALGGVGGYAIGRAADGPPTGIAGATGEYGHHRGPSDADGGLRGDRDGDGPVGDGPVGDGPAGDGPVGDGSAGTAPGGVGSSGTGTGSTGSST
jgi:hypothetical protein